MDAVETGTTNNWMKETEIVEFYRALAITQAKMFSYLSEANGDGDELKRRAAELTADLQSIANQHLGSPDKCYPLIWNPITLRCE